MTLEQAKSLKVGQVLKNVRFKDADGSPERWRVTGRPKVWKTRPDRVRIPVKHGLYDYGYVTEKDLGLFELA